MADWPNWTTAYNWALNRYGASQTYLAASITDLNNAWTHYYAGNALACCQDIMYCCNKFQGCIQALETYDISYDIPFATVWMLKYLQAGMGATVDMDDILSAMLGAKGDQLVQFIGIEQAYMAAIWNAPFNADYYAALARGWRIWQ